MNCKIDAIDGNGDGNGIIREKKPILVGFGLAETIESKMGELGDGSRD